MASTKMFSSNTWCLFGISILSLCCGEAQALAQSSQDSPEQQQTFRSLPFATPLTLEGDPLERQITSIELRLPPLNKEPAEGSIVFDESELSFNEFGDATVVHRKGGTPLAIKVTLMIGVSLYRVHLRDDRFNPDLQFVNSQDPLSPNRLLIKTLKKDPSGRELQLLRILPLIGIDHPLDEREPDPLRTPLGLSTPHLHNGLIADSTLPPGSYQIKGKLGGIVQLTHDLNSVGFDLFGGTTFSTALLCHAFQYQLKKLLIDDPTKQSRTVWELVPTPGGIISFETLHKDVPIKDQPSYRLVTSPHAGGPHRLLIYKGGSIHNVLPLNNDRWLHFQQQRRE